MQSDLLHGLNDQQKEAAIHTEGPLMIVAGAGTGKTTVITRRIAWLIEQGFAKPENILALTFTDKAAGEMEERVDILLPYGYADLQISTFHAFCEKLLRDYGVEIGLSRDFQLLSELDAWLLVRQNFDRFDLDHYRPLGNPTKHLKSLLSHFSRAKDAGIRPDDYLEFAESKLADLDTSQGDDDATLEIARLSELAKAYHTYQEIILENDSLDFGDLILFSLKLLQDRPAVLKEVQQRYKFILVDEFQDTNHAQYELIKLLAGTKKNITVVGDDDQAIYKFRGASLANILEFDKDFPNAKKVVLKKNYRSGQKILDLAYGFIQKNNPNRLEAQNETLSKKLEAHKDIDTIIEHMHSGTLEEEVVSVMKRINELKKADESVVWNDFAVLVRSNSAGTDFAAAFERSTIPYQFLALSGLYTKPVVLDVLAMLRVIDNPYDSPSMYRVFTMEFWGVQQTTIAELNQLARRKGKSLNEAAELARSLSDIPPEEMEKIRHILSTLSVLRQEAGKQRSSQMMIKVVRDTGYLEYLNSIHERSKQEAFSFLQQFYKRMKSFETRHDHPVLHHFLAEFSHERDAGEEGSLSVDLEAGPDMVRILTIHAAKGLEFRYVFVVNMIDRRFPTQRRAEAIKLPDELNPEAEQDKEQHLEEERRLFYVAATRAKQGLFLTSADDYGGSRTRKLSRFLDELGYTKPDESRIPTIVGILDEDQDEGRGVRDEGRGAIVALPKQFSFTQLAAFRTCPLQYKFAHVLKVPVFGKWTFSFGKTIHSTLQKFFTVWLERAGTQQTSLFDSNLPPSQGGTKGGCREEYLPVELDELYQFYDDAWQDDWYIDDRQREAYRKKGREQLKTYYDSLHQNMPSPLNLEQGFTLKFDDVVLKGRIDRIDAFEDGVEIIDYKTGSPKSANKISKQDKEQLYLYQIAAGEVLGLVPKKLTFHYLEDNSKVSFLAKDEELETLKKDIVKRVESIRSSAFAATPGFHCKYCDFADICEFRQK